MKLRFLILSVAIFALFANYDPVSCSRSDKIDSLRNLIDQYETNSLQRKEDLDKTANDLKIKRDDVDKRSQDLSELSEKLNNNTDNLGTDDLDDAIKDYQGKVNELENDKKDLEKEENQLKQDQEQLNVDEQDYQKNKSERDRLANEEEENKRIEDAIANLKYFPNFNLSEDEYNNLDVSNFTLTLKKGVWEYLPLDSGKNPVGQPRHIGKAEAAQYILKVISGKDENRKLEDIAEKFCKDADITVNPTPPATEVTNKDAKAPLFAYYENAEKQHNTSPHSHLSHGANRLGLGDMASDNDWGDCYDDPKKWKDHRPHCFRLINNNNFKAVVKKALINVKDEPSKYDDNKEPHENIARLPKSFAQLITDQDVLACQSQDCLKLLAYIMKKPDMIKAESFKNVNGIHLSTWAHLVRETSRFAKDQTNVAEYVPATIFNLISEAQLRTFGPVIVNGLGSEVFNLADPALKAVLSNPKSCAALKTSTLTKLMGSSKAKFLNSECLAKANLQGVEIPGKIENVLKDGFSQVNTCLSESLTKALSVNHVEEFATAVPEVLKRGSNLNFDKLAANSVKGITQAVLIGKLADRTGSYELFTASEVKNRLSKNLSSTILKDVSNEDMINSLTHLSANDIEAFPSELLQTLVKDYPRLCTLLPVKNIYAKINFSNAECVRYMTPEVQALTLATADHVADDFLAYVNADSYDKWSLDKDLIKSKRNDGFNKVTIFDAKSKERSNIEKVIANFGTKADGKDPCTVIPSSVSEIAEGKNLSKYITVNCYNKAVREMPEDTKGIPARFHILKSYLQLKKDPNFSFEKLTQEKMSDLSSGGAFCSFVEKENFDKIPTAALKGLSSHCVSELSFVDQLSKDQVAAMPGHAFEHIPANRINAQIIESMTAAQLSHAASKVSDVEQGNVGALLVYSVMEQFDAAKLGAVTSNQWAKVPADSFRAINSAEKLKAITSGAMEHWTLDQVKQAPNDIWAALSIDQAKAIGSKAPADAAPHSHLLSMSGLSNEVREELRRGAVEPSAGWATMTIVIIVVGSVAVLSLIGLGVWYFMRK